MSEQSILAPPKEDLSIRDNLAKITRFAKELTVALHDVQLEQAGLARDPASPGVRYFYDADVCIRMIIGFQHHRTAHAPASPEEEIVRALLASQVLGTLMLLPPYVWEIDDGLRRQGDFVEEEDFRIFRSRAEEFIEKQDLRGLLTDLSRRIDENIPSKEILRSFASLAPQTFVALESVNGVSKKRLERFAKWGLMRFDATGWEIPELLETDTGRILQAAITEVRPKQKWLLNNLRDAAALTALSQMIAEPARFGRVRFYTESDALWKMVNNDLSKGGADAVTTNRNIGRVSRVLSYPRSGDHPEGMFDADCRHIFRTPYYYLVRARFSALRFPRGQVRTGANDMSIDQLMTTAGELEKLLRGSEKQSAAQLMSVRVEGKYLADIIDELESLSFIGTLWEKYDDLIENLEEYLSEWANVWKFVTNEGTAQLIDTEIGNIRKQFGARLSLLKAWGEDLLSIRTAVKKLRDKCANSPAPEPMRDLGLVRWGATLHDNQQSSLKRRLSGLLDPSEPVFEIAVQEIASILHKPKLDGQDTISLGAILWLLGQNKMISNAVERFIEHASESDAVTLRILAAAATLRGTPVIEIAAIAETLRQVKEFVQKRPGHEQSRYLLGLAYVHYYAWFDAGEKDELHHWAAESFDYAEQAVNHLPPNSLSWAFAVNHCVYVGFTARMLTKALPHRERLMKLLSRSGEDDVWHYRFADTLAVTHWVVARDRLRSVHDQVPSPEVLRFVENELKLARKYLAMADPSFGDSDIDRHLGEVELLQSQVDGYKLDIAQAATKPRRTNLKRI